MPQRNGSQVSQRDRHARVARSSRHLLRCINADNLEPGLEKRRGIASGTAAEVGDAAAVSHLCEEARPKLGVVRVHVAVAPGVVSTIASYASAVVARTSSAVTA